MQFEALEIPGAFVVSLQPHVDARGFFARSFCRQEFLVHGLDPVIDQCNVSFNSYKGTLRGMHFQRPPHEEVKLVRCTRGEAYDVVLDLRPGSPTFRQWSAVEITAANHKAVYVPRGCAHGFQTLCAETELLYYMSESFHPDFADGVRWNDPAFAIAWPIADAILSERDNSYPNFLP